MTLLRPLVVEFSAPLSVKIWCSSGLSEFCSRLVSSRGTGSCRSDTLRWIFNTWTMCLWSAMLVPLSLHNLVLLHHPLYLVVDLASVVGHGEVRLLTELVPAYVGVLAELLLQTNPKCLWFRGPIETTFLQRNAQLVEIVASLKINTLQTFIQSLFSFWTLAAAYLIEQGKHTERTSLNKIQAALIILVFDKGPLKALRHVLLLEEAVRNMHHAYCSTTPAFLVHPGNPIILSTGVLKTKRRCLGRMARLNCKA